MKGLRYFRRFIDLNEMNEQEAEGFNKLVSLLYERSKSLWIPRRCRNILGLDSIANGIIKELGIRCFNEIKMKRFLTEHFFLDSSLKRNGKVLIIDPIGLPLSLANLEICEPYFGLIENAKHSHRRKYNLREELDENGTKDVPYVFKFS